jgi:hypothetical protein
LNILFWLLIIWILNFIKNIFPLQTGRLGITIIYKCASVRARANWIRSSLPSTLIHRNVCSTMMDGTWRLSQICHYFLGSNIILLELIFQTMLVTQNGSVVWVWYVQKNHAILEVLSYIARLGRKWLISKFMIFLNGYE